MLSFLATEAEFSSFSKACSFEVSRLVDLAIKKNDELKAYEKNQDFKIKKTEEIIKAFFEAFKARVLTNNKRLGPILETKKEYFSSYKCCPENMLSFLETLYNRLSKEYLCENGAFLMTWFCLDLRFWETQINCGEMVFGVNAFPEKFGKNKEIGAKKAFCLFLRENNQDETLAILPFKNVFPELKKNEKNSPRGSQASGPKDSKKSESESESDQDHSPAKQDENPPQEHQASGPKDSFRKNASDQESQREQHGSKADPQQKKNSSLVFIIVIFVIILAIVGVCLLLLKK